MKSDIDLIFGYLKFKYDEGEFSEKKCNARFCLSQLSNYETAEEFSSKTYWLIADHFANQKARTFLPNELKNEEEKKQG